MGLKYQLKCKLDMFQATLVVYDSNTKPNFTIQMYRCEINPAIIFYDGKYPFIHLIVILMVTDHPILHKPKINNGQLGCCSYFNIGNLKQLLVKSIGYLELFAQQAFKEFSPMKE